MNQLLIEFEKYIIQEEKYDRHQEIKRIKHVREKMDDEFDSFLAENGLKGRYEGFTDLIGAKVVFVSNRTTHVFAGSVIHIYFEKYEWYKDKHERKVAIKKGDNNFSYYIADFVTSFGKLNFHGGGDWTCYSGDNVIEGIMFFC